MIIIYLQAYNVKPSTNTIHAQTERACLILHMSKLTQFHYV